MYNALIVRGSQASGKTTLIYKMLLCDDRVALCNADELTTIKLPENTTGITIRCMCSLLCIEFLENIKIFATKFPLVKLIVETQDISSLIPTEYRQSIFIINLSYGRREMMR